MRLAFTIFRYFPFGGLQRDMLAMAQAAVEQGHQVTIYCGEWLGDKPKKIPVVIVNANTRFKRNNVKAFVDNFTAIFQRNSVDLVVGFNKMPGLDVYFAGDSCFAQKALAERNIFYRLTARARLYLQYERAVFGEESRTAILSISALEQKSFARYYSCQAERFYDLPPGIAPAQYHCEKPLVVRQRLRETWQADADTKIILCIGSGFKTKGVDRSVAAFAQFHKKIPNALLIIVGADNSKSYCAQAKNLGVSDRVRFLGGRTDIAELLQAADVLLHPAYRELAGNVILEAMLAGKPVVTTEVCGFAHYVAEHKMGVVLDSPYQQQKCVAGLLSAVAIDSTIWQARAQVFANNVDVKTRQTQAVTILEQLVSAQSQPTHEVVINTAEYNVILRDECIASWARSDVFLEVQNLSGPIARELADRQTLRFELNGQGYYRKFHRGVGWQEIIKNLIQLRLPVLGAKNEWQALNKLRALAIPSLDPVAYGEQKHRLATKKSFIVTRELPNVIQLDHYFQQHAVGVKAKIGLIHKVAHIARDLHQAGINHRDFYLCHFMLNIESMLTWQQKLTEPVLYIIDLHRAQIRPKVPKRWLVKDLSGLYFSSLDMGFTQKDYFRFMRDYWQLSLRDILLQHQALLQSISERAVKTYRRDTGKLPVLPMKNSVHQL